MDDFTLDDFDYQDYREHDEVFERMLDAQYLDSLDPEVMDDDDYDENELAANAASEWENSRERLY
jgi:hypothetical protein